MEGNPTESWSPLPDDGDWLNAKHWSKSLAMCSDRDEGLRALAALDAAFPPPWASEQRLPKLHPASVEWMGPKHRLLQMGTMLSLLDQPDRYYDRLRDAKRYDRARAELEAGLLFHRLGAITTPEPLSRRRR